MRYNALLFRLVAVASLAVCMSCTEAVTLVPASGRQPSDDELVTVLFTVGEDFGLTRASAMLAVGDSVFEVRYEPMTLPESKVTETTGSSMDSFYLNVSKGSEISVVENRIFTRSGGVYSNDGVFWPHSDESYHFYACNKTLLTGASRHLVSCDGSQDVVYAHKADPAYKQTNGLVFAHAYSRMGSLAVNPPAGFSAVITSATLTASTTGNVDVRTGSWSGVGAASAIALSSSNDILVVPGTYDVSVTFTLTDGVTQRSGIVRSKAVTFTAGLVTNITANVADAYGYGLSVSPASVSLEIGDGRQLAVTYVTMYNDTQIASQDVTSSASWSSANPSVASVSSSGVVAGVAAGSTTVTASYGGCQASVPVTVSDGILSWGDVTVSLSYPVVSYGGGSVNPTMSYSQVVNYKSGAQGVVHDSGAVSVVYSKVSGSFMSVVNASTGSVSCTSNARGSYSSSSYGAYMFSSGIGYPSTYVSFSGGIADIVGTPSPRLYRYDYYEATSLRSGRMRVTVTGQGGVTGSAESNVVQNGNGNPDYDVTIVDAADYTITYSLQTANGCTVNSSTGRLSYSYNGANVGVSFSDPVIDEFSYSPTSFDHNGGMAYLQDFSYHYTKRTHYTATSNRRPTVRVRVTYPAYGNATDYVDIYGSYQSGSGSVPADEYDTIRYGDYDDEGEVTFSFYSSHEGFSFDYWHDVHIDANGSASERTAWPMVSVTIPGGDSDYDMVLLRQGGAPSELVIEFD